MSKKGFKYRLSGAPAGLRGRVHGQALEDKSRYRQLVRSKQTLEKIDKLLDKLERSDPYGDMHENFESSFEGKRHTRRLIEMIDQDLSLYSEKYGAFR